MKLNEKLHLVVPLYDGDDEASVIYAYVHSAPISRETFEAHWLLLSKTFTAIFAQGLGEIGGPRVASLVMRDVAKALKDEDGYTALMNEIRRLTNVLVRKATGWETLPFDAAKSLVSDDDLAEATNAVCFFTAVSAMTRRGTLKDMLTGAAGLWGAQIVLLDFTGFAASHKTSTAIVNTGESRRAASSVPH